MKQSTVKTLQRSAVVFANYSFTVLIIIISLIDQNEEALKTNFLNNKTDIT